jgi:hypothetical protein
VTEALIYGRFADSPLSRVGIAGTTNGLCFSLPQGHKPFCIDLSKERAGLSPRTRPTGSIEATSSLLKKRSRLRSRRAKADRASLRDELGFGPMVIEM